MHARHTCVLSNSIQKTGPKKQKNKKSLNRHVKGFLWKKKPKKKKHCNDNKL